MTIPTDKIPNDAFAYLLDNQDSSKSKLVRIATLSDLQVGLPEFPAELQVTGRLSQSSSEIKVQPFQTINYPPDATFLFVVVYNPVENGQVTIILPENPRQGQTCYVKDASGTSGICRLRIVSSGSSAVDGSSEKFLNYKYGSFGLIWSGSSWTTIASSGIENVLDQANVLQQSVANQAQAISEVSRLVNQIKTDVASIDRTSGGGGGGGGGTGDVVGPASSTTNAIAKYTDTTGKLLSNTSVTIDASNNVTVPGRIIVTGGTTSATDATLGNAAVGSFPFFDGGGSSGVYAMFGHKDLDHSTAVTNYAIYQDNTGNTAINASNDKSLILSVNNTIMGFLTNNLLGTGIDAISLTGETSTKTNMALGNTTLDSATTIYAGTGDLNVGHNAADRNVNLGTGNNASNQDVVVGSTYDRSSLLLRAGTGNMLLTGAISTDYTVGGPGGTGTITLGRSKSTNTIDIGSAGNSTSFTQTVNIAAGTGTSNVTIGSKSGTSPMVLQAGTSGLSVSGSARFNQGLSGSLTKLANGTSYLIAGSNVTITTGSSGAVTIASSGGSPGGSDTHVQFNDGGSTFGGDSGLTYNKTTDTLTISGDLNVNGGDVATTSTGTAALFNTNATTLNVGGAALLLNVGTDPLDSRIISIGPSNDAGSADDTINSTVNVGNTPSNPASSTTVNIGTAGGGVTVNTVSIGNYLTSPASITTIYGDQVNFPQGLSGSLTRLTDGTSYIRAGTNVTVTSASNGAVTISSTATVDSFFTSTTAGSIFTTGSVALRGSVSSVDAPSDKGTNVFFYVSGSISGSGANDKRALFGGDVVISGSLRQGNLNDANGIYSHAEGFQNTASGNSSHAEGAYTVASGDYSHAEGTSTSAVASYSHAEGYYTTATGQFSHAEGNSTIAAGLGAHAEGDSTTAAANYSHAEGSQTIASASFSLAAGIGTITSGSGQAAFGKYNKRSNSTSLFIIGDGTGNSDATRGDILRANPGSSIGRGLIEVTGSLAATLGLSGSLTKLVDGTSYLIAGSNITISSASNGAVTISSAGGTPGGLDTYVQFNDGGSFGGDSGLTYNKTTDTLTISGDLNVNGGDQNTTASTFNLLQSASILNICTTAENTVNIGTGASLTANTQTINAGTGAGRNVVTVGSVSSNALGQGSSLTLLAGTGNMLLSGTTNTTYTVGSELGTGEIRVGRSTANNTVSIANGATSSGNTQLINIGNATGTGGVATISIASSSLGLKKVFIGRIDSGYLTGGTPGSEVYIGGNSIKIGDNDGATRSTILITGSITCRGVTTSTADLQAGAAEIGSFPAYTADPTVFAMFGHATLNHGALGNYALLQSSVGATALNAASGQAAYFRNNNNDLGLCSDGLMTFTGRAGVTTTTLLGNSADGSITGLYGGTLGVYITGSFGTPYYIGGETSTGSIVIGRSKADQTIDIGKVSTTSPSTTTTTINIGTAGGGFSRNIIGIGNYGTSSPQGEGQSTTTIFGDTISIGTSGTPTTTIGSSQDASSIRINAGSGGITLSGSGGQTVITGSSTTYTDALIGAWEIGSLPATQGSFPNVYAFIGHKDLNQAVDGNYALVQSNTGDTFLSAVSGRDIFFKNGTDIIGQLDNSTVSFTGKTGTATTTTLGNSSGASATNISAGSGGIFVTGSTTISATTFNFPTGSSTTCPIVVRTDIGANIHRWALGMDTSADLNFAYGLNTTTVLSKGYLNDATNVGAIDFTGQHRSYPASGTISQFINAVGMIVVSSGQYKNLISGSSEIFINEALPLVKLSSTRNQKSVFGVVSECEDPNENSRWYEVGNWGSVYVKRQNDDRLIINSLGEGAIWVCNINGNLENGDYITTCEIPGYGMKQDDDLLHNYTVAKITCDCDFTLDNGFYQCEEFVYEGVTYRRAFVGCTYHCG